MMTGDDNTSESTSIDPHDRVGPVRRTLAWVNFGVWMAVFFVTVGGGL